MLRVRTYLAPSAIDGIGLFAAEPIQSGQLIWKFHEQLDMKVDLRTIRDQDDEFVRAMVLRYGYQPTEEPVFIICGDNARFMNHSPAPNADDVGEITLARLHIAAGDEITCNYAKFDHRFAEHGFAVGWA